MSQYIFISFRCKYVYRRVIQTMKPEFQKKIYHPRIGLDNSHFTIQDNQSLWVLQEHVEFCRCIHSHLNPCSFSKFPLFFHRYNYVIFYTHFKGFNKARKTRVDVIHAVLTWRLTANAAWFPAWPAPQRACPTFQKNVHPSGDFDLCGHSLMWQSITLSVSFNQNTPYHSLDRQRRVNIVQLLSCFLLQSGESLVSFVDINWQPIRFLFSV